MEKDKTTIEISKDTEALLKKMQDYFFKKYGSIHSYDTMIYAEIKHTAKKLKIIGVKD